MITNQTLKNAARAIEHDLWTDPSGANYLVKDGAILRRWEPETSGADSFELLAVIATKFSFRLSGGRSFSSGNTVLDLETSWPKSVHGAVVERDSGDVSSEMRRIIVLAAAKIGAAL